MSTLFPRDSVVGSFRGTGPLELNWLYLVESIVVIILITFYFFYLNRVTAIIVSFVLRLLLWRSNNSYFTLGGIQFSLLAGRITFSDLRYISRNQSLRVVKGHITWRYWLWRVRSEEDLPAEASLPCRVTVSLQGAEWFLYNRTPSYDAILEQLGVVDPLPADIWSNTSSDDPKTNSTSNLRSDADVYPPLPSMPVPPKKAPTDWIREALPIDISCKKGSIIMGNPSTSNILIAGFEKVSGSYAAVKSRSRFDDYKQVYRFTFAQPKIVFRTNPDYEGAMTKHGPEMLKKLSSNPAFGLQEFLRSPSRFGTLLAFRQLLRGIPRQRKNKSFQPKGSERSTGTAEWAWQGLPRYQAAFEGINEPAHRAEYGKVTTILASPEMELTYYCDTAGKVPEVARVVTGFAGLETFDVGNGDLAPEWGVDVVIKGGVITYGPWADRQRSELQQAFTPTTFFNAKPTARLKPGDERMHTALKIFDWKYDGIDANSLEDSTIRPYGWLDVTLGPNSTVSYVLPMVATSAGYDTLCEFHLDEMSVTSSVNYATFLEAETCRVHVGLPSPLVWDEERTWSIDVTVSKPEINLLRDHITLFSDIAKDWTSGPPGDYEHFVPFHYAFSLNLTDYTLRLFVNDHNIIISPSALEDNTFIICRGPRLAVTSVIPSNKYRMECSTVPFNVVVGQQRSPDNSPKTDVFEVDVSLNLRNGLCLLPQELYDCRSAVILVLPQLLVDLRNHDFFMELAVNLDPFKIVEAPDAPSIIKEDFSAIYELPDAIRVQGLEVTANRLFGPQPRTATYICIWSFYLGPVVGNVLPSLLQALSCAGTSIGLNFGDDDNSLPPDFLLALDPDATFLTVDIKSVDLSVRGQGTAVQFDLPDGVAIRFDDLASAPFLKHIEIDVPSFHVRFLAPLFGRAAPWMEVASLDADLSIVLGLSETGWEEKAKVQLAFIKAQDALTKRCPFIYGHGHPASAKIGDLFLPALAEPFTSRAPGGSGIAEHGERRTSIHVASRKPVRVVITPVAVQVGADVLDCVVDDRDFERSLDSLFKDYVASQKSAPTIRYSLLEIKASVPSLEIEAIQDVLRPEHTISIKRRDDGEDEGPLSTVLCTVRLRLDNIEVTSSETSDGFGGHERASIGQASSIVDRKLSSSLGGLQLEVFHPSHTAGGIDGLSTRQNHTLPSTPSKPRVRPTALDLVMGRCDLELDFTPSRARIAVHGGTGRLDFVDEAAELVIGSIWSWRVVTDIAGPLAERSSQQDAFLRQLVWSITHESEEAAITSFPPFLNRVSYLVGSAANLRSDDGWKILHNLRHCLRVTKLEIEDALREERSWPSSRELLADVVDFVARWRSWEIDAEDLANAPFLSSLFGSNHAHPHPPSSDVATADLSWATPIEVEWRAGGLNALLSDGKTSENWLHVGPMEAYLSSTGKTSTGDHLRGRARVTLHSVDANVDRDLLLLIRHIVNVRNTFERKIQIFRQNISTLIPDSSSVVEHSATGPLASLPTMLVDFSLGIQRASAKALADTLQATTDIHDSYATVSIFVESKLSRHSRPQSHRIASNSSLTIGGVSLAAKDATHGELLLATGMDGLRFVADVAGSHAWEGDAEDEVVPSLQIVLGADAFHTNVPRAAVRVHEFLENFRQSNLPTYDTLLTELRQGLDDIQTDPFRPPSDSSPVLERMLSRARLGLQLAVPLVTFEVQAIPTLKAAYSIRDFSIYARTSEGPVEGGFLGQVEAGLHIGAQSIRMQLSMETATVVSSKPRSPASTREATLPAETAFDLPVVQLKAHFDGVPCKRVAVLTTIDSVSVKLTATIIDNVLAIQNHFGKDIDELLEVIRAKRARQESLLAESATPTLPPPTPEVEDHTPVEWDLRVALRGLKVGLEGPQATQWVEAELIEGRASSSAATSFLALHWEASVQNLALSLAQRTTVPEATLDRRYRLAFFRLDLFASNSVINLSELPPESIHENKRTPHLHLRLPRIHAVLQPTAIVALGDLIDYFEEEIGIRKSLRQSEVEAIRERVNQLTSDEEAPAVSWLSSCVVSLEAQSVGFAIPLNDDGIPAPDFALRRNKSAQSRPAFLVTIPTLKFANQRGSAGYARIDQLGVQFVSDFDQGRKEDFDGATHQSLNRVVFPEMKSTLRSPRNGPMLAHSNVSGLEIDLEPSVVAYAFSLIDVMRLSHERFAKFAPTPTASDVAEEVSPAPPPAATSAAECRSTLQATFEFASGVIRMHTRRVFIPPTKPSQRSARPQAHRRGRSLNDFSVLRNPFTRPSESSDPLPNIFRLPGMSVWAEYGEGALPTDVSRLHVDIVIHASNNTLYPSLIPFIAAIASQLKDRALQTPTSPPTPGSPTPPPPTPTLSIASVPPSPSPTSAPAPWGRLKFGLSLKVDQSRLEISCLPAAEVTARLTWESGGFLLTISPETRGVEFGLTIDGVAAGLRHSFSPEDCLHAEAKGITGSVSFTGVTGQMDAKTGLLSVMVDLPDVSAEMNFRHLQDWLCLKAVWLDRMDLGPATAAPPKAPPRPLAAPMERAKDSSIVTLALVQIGKLRFVCDLGQAIGRSTTVASTANARLRWVPGESRSLTLSLQSLEMTGQGRAGGSATIDGVLFSTRLRDEALRESSASTDLLHIQIGLGKISAALEYEFHKILLVNADPIAVSVGDDWSRATTADAELELGFKVKMGSFNVIATVATVPTLVNVTRKVQMLVEEKSALADSTIANAGLPPRPSTTAKSGDAVSAFASKLALSPDSAGDIRILNRLDIEVDRIRIAIFPEHFNDGEVFRIDAGGTIRAQLVRGVDAQKIIHRHLTLFLGFFSIRKVNHRKLNPTQEREYTVIEWYELFRTSTERNIFKVPTTEVSMKSEQEVGGLRLEHKFSMTFGGQVDIALNYALLRNLGSLATSYQEQMDQVQSATWKPAMSPKEGAGELPAAIPEAASPADTATQTIGVDSLPSHDSDIIKMKLMPLGQAATGESRTLEYEAKEMDVHQPQLNLLGD
ncbi:hypothetical protein MNV49_003310, partial [Pseudohyphozyma bogoriensis]